MSARLSYQQTPNCHLDPTLYPLKVKPPEHRQQWHSSCQVIKIIHNFFILKKKAFSAGSRRQFHKFNQVDVATSMGQLKLRVVFHLFFSSVIWISSRILCGKQEVSANYSEGNRKTITSPESNRLIRLASRQSTPPPTLGFLRPVSFASEGPLPLREALNSPTKANSLGLAEDDTISSSAKELYEACISMLGPFGQSNENPAVPVGSSSSQPQSKHSISSNPSSVPSSGPSANQNSSQASSKSSGSIDPATSSRPSPPSESTNSAQTSPITKDKLPQPPLNSSASQNVTSQPSIVNLPSSNTTSGSLSNPSPINGTSNSPLSNPASTSQNKPPASIGSQKSNSKPVGSDDQKKIVIAGCIILAMLLILGTILLVVRRTRSKDRLNKMNRGLEESGILQRPGEFGKRGTVLVGRGIESQQGLPRSGGWLDTRVASTVRPVSVLSSRPSSTNFDARQAPLNPV